MEGCIIKIDILKKDQETIAALINILKKLSNCNCNGDGCMIKIELLKKEQ